MRQLLNLLKKTAKPNYCELIVTEKCFFRCSMCDMWKKKHEDTPPLGKWKKFLDDFRKVIDLPFRVGICGGETLMYPHVEELASYAKALGFDVMITTNAFLIDSKKAESLCMSGIDTFVISLDSIEEEVHDGIRGMRGSWRKVMEAIDHLSRYESSINIISVIMSQNMDSILPLAKWAADNEKIDSISFNSLTRPIASDLADGWRKDSSRSHLWPDHAKAQQIIDSLIEMKKDGNSKVGNGIRQLKTFRQYYQYPDRFVKEGSCHMGSSVSVNSEGSIFMCHHYGSVGNIRDENFDKIWKDKKASEIRKKILDCDRNCKMLINCNFEE